MNLGLTGGIATGKSTVSSLLEERGALIIDADRVAREVVLPGSPALQQVAERFGQAVLLEDGSLNRKKLGEIVFADEAERKALESILHPAIRSVMRERMEAFERDYPDKLVVADIPLLYESGLESMYEEIMVVYVPREVQLQRLMKRDGMSAEEAGKRLNAQFDIEWKKRQADYVIDNRASLDETKKQIDRFWHGKGLA
ncbi:Dephospho-CoA kinase [Paenibacillus sp. CECT 9249]|uniref:dephospho-CoA kinase n=1 Tax=Paenibacillus sp. CECT 9249 TaxID=2845385 RepID=UPI001E58142E|nr:dephospho-CoA kinase [Paenibacillus sp. CECT 9249]CAH0117720.1 Dephospho-CoA kinase [Paenibacillus sp. CECT 9249]